MIKRAIVTGGNSGIGFATAKKLCDNGMLTYIIGRTKDKTENASLELGQNAIPVIFDLNNLEAIPDMISKISDGHNIDILVNNAGIHEKKDFIDVTDEEFATIIHTNILSVFTVSREVTKIMKHLSRIGRHDREPFEKLSLDQTRER